MNGLKELRKKKGMTLQEVADRMGCGNSSICMYETGKRTPNLDQLQALARAYKSTPMEIINAWSKSNEQGTN